MITILGTSHVSKQSSKEVREAIEHADIVALELDRGRFEGLLSDKKATFNEMRAALGLKAATIASVLRYFQEKIAKSLNVLPGVEMRAAIKEAAKQQKPLALIDRDIRVTLQRFSKYFGWPEVKQMLKDGFRKQEISIHPSDDVVSQLLEQMKDKYPRIYNVMVRERDTFMAHQLIALQEQNPDKRILAVVGKAHLQGLLHQINYLKEGIDVQAWSSQATSVNT